jgi:integrase/recombinase XerD
MTQLRKRMLEELQRRNYSPGTIRPYLYAIDFARHFGKSPDKLSQEHLRQYQLNLVNDRKLKIGTIVGRISAIRFFFVNLQKLPQLLKGKRAGDGDRTRDVRGCCPNGLRCPGDCIGSA